MKNFLKSMGIVAIFISILSGVIFGIAELHDFILLNYGISIFPIIIILILWLILSYIFYGLFYS